MLCRWGKSAENLDPTNESMNSIPPGSLRQSRGDTQTGKFRSRISGFLTDECLVCTFAHHTHKHKHRKTRLSNACRKTHTLGSPPSLFFGLEAVQTTRPHAGKRVKRECFSFQ